MYVQIQMELDMTTIHIGRLNRLIIQAITLLDDPQVGMPQATTRIGTITQEKAYITLIDIKSKTINNCSRSHLH